MTWALNRFAFFRHVGRIGIPPALTATRSRAGKLQEQMRDEDTDYVHHIIFNDSSVNSGVVGRKF